MRALKSFVLLCAGLVVSVLLVPVASVGPVQAAPLVAAAAPDPCGAKIARPGGGHWTCSLVDNFNGSRLNGQLWTVITQPGHDDLCMLNSPRTVSVGLGSLRLSAIAATGPNACPLRADRTRAPYAGGWVSSYYRWSQQYGRFESRIKVQAANGSGLHEAFWLWPDTRYGADTPWPASGEIDIMETFSNHPDIAVPYLHYGRDDNGGPVPGLNTAWDCAARRGVWNTYVLEWTATWLRISVNGRTCLVNTHGAASFRKRFIINFTQFLGGGSNLYSGAVRLPATMYVDYVKVWK